MKKISFILLALLCWSSMVSAQENNNRLRKKYRKSEFCKAGIRTGFLLRYGSNAQK